MERINSEIIINTSPAEVWEVVRDVGNISDQFEGIAGITLVSKSCEALVSLR